MLSQFRHPEAFMNDKREQRINFTSVSFYSKLKTMSCLALQMILF